MQLKLQHILLFLLVHGLTTILLVGGLAGADGQNGLRQVPIVLDVICFSAVGKNRATDQNKEQLVNCDTVPLALLWKSD